MSKVVMVTGVSTGFGRLTVEALAGRGHTVFAALRDVAGRNAPAAAELRALPVQVVELDVTDQASAERAVSEVVAAAGRIDVVVNNAGMIFPGPVEAFTAGEVQRQFDVNVLGAVRVNRAALPQLRQQGHGLLLQVGSVAGRVTTPYTGLYAASKAALESLTEAWRHELAPFGIESVILEPASYPTSIGTNAVMPADQARLGAYGEGFGGFVTAIAKRSAEVGGEPGEVADAVVRLIEAPDGSRPLRTVVGPADQDEILQAFNLAAATTAQRMGAAMGVGSFMAD